MLRVFAHLPPSQPASNSSSQADSVVQFLDCNTARTLNTIPLSIPASQPASQPRIYARKLLMQLQLLDYNEHGNAIQILSHTSQLTALSTLPSQPASLAFLLAGCLFLPNS